MIAPIAKKLPPKGYRAVELANEGQLTIREIAAELGLAYGTLQFYFAIARANGIWYRPPPSKRLVYREPNPHRGPGKYVNVFVPNDLLPLLVDTAKELDMAVTTVVRVALANAIERGSLASLITDDDR
jgi:hypothetical protein